MTIKFLTRLLMVLLVVLQINSQCIDKFRTVKVNATSRVGSLRLLAEYLEEGAVLETFEPSVVPQNLQGAGYYVNSSNPNTGVSGFLKFQIGT